MSPKQIFVCFFRQTSNLFNVAFWMNMRVSFNFFFPVEPTPIDVSLLTIYDYDFGDFKRLSFCRLFNQLINWRKLCHSRIYQNGSCHNFCNLFDKSLNLLAMRNSSLPFVFFFFFRKSHKFEFWMWISTWNDESIQSIARAPLKRFSHFVRSILYETFLKFHDKKTNSCTYSLFGLQK